ncbi:MAG: HEAT repeat domain-containing protein, partial [Planctomycetota bacterium]
PGLRIWRMPAPLERRRRPLMLAGGVLLTVIVAVAVILPALLTPARPAGRAPGTRAPEGLQPVPDGTPPRPATTRPERPASPSGSGRDDASSQVEGRAAHAPPAESLPIIEHQRVHQGGDIPGPAGRPVPGVARELQTHPPVNSAGASGQVPATTEAGRAGEWDRSGRARRAGVAQFGGTPLTESAVESGLSWLAAHQNERGTWDRLHFERCCPADDRCGGSATRRENDDLEAGLAGLSLLAFLGAGCTNREGEHQQPVAAGVAGLLRLQQPHGGFSTTESMAGYNDALATFALAEYTALTRDPRARAPLAQAVARIVATQQARGGWDYLPDPRSGRNDTSISAWMVQALHACAAAGVDVPRRTMVRAGLFFTQNTERDGRVRYADTGSGFRVDEQMRPVYQYGAGMLAAGLTIEQLLGWRLDSGMPLKQRGLVLADLPSAGKARGGDQFHNEYYWYYGTLAMFQRGGQDWQTWNHSLRDAILPLQNREKTADGRKRHTFGSWPAYGPNWGMFGRMGGRVYTTAICTLTLEIYYRHTPAFLREDLLFSADDWRALLAEAAAAERLAAVECVRQLRLEVSEPVLVSLLDDTDARVVLAAAEALAWLDSPLGVPLIERSLPTKPPWERQVLEQALERGRTVLLLPKAEGRVRLYDARARLATLALARSYVGMQIEVMRGRTAVAQMRVIQRFTGRDVVVAELLEGPGLPQAGDEVRGR